ncbi:uncharacterized protein LOC131433839 [Malaya genurostris]|uniref:uncharacterized protein LOC131433839 n=1 Tax=Malaya genurostris TaxID=325434 RepID=UPI0026F3EF75|nr:uncharacterized protein LOC131433839 [Malaya genurostris]
MSIETPMPRAKKGDPRKLELPEKDEEENQTPSVSAQKVKKKAKEEMKKAMAAIKVMNSRMDSVRNKLMRVRSSLESSQDVPNPNLKCKQFLQLQLKTIESAFAEYDQLHQRVFEADVEDEVREEAEEAYVRFEQQYGELFIYISKLIDDNIKMEEDAARTIQPLQSMQNRTSEVALHLPPLKVPLPTFDGTYENWFAFRSMFETIMQRYSSEAPGIKLYHLRNSLVGKAAGIIDQEIINNNDYNAAWKMLIERYEDKRLIIDKHIDALFNLPKLLSENASDLRKLIDTCTKNVEALKNLGLPVEGLGECMMINRLVSKLDTETRKAWELNHVDDDLPGYDDTLEFLRERCKVLEKIQPAVKQVLKNQKPVRNVQEAKGKTSTLLTVTDKCPQCSNNHELWRCDTFKNVNLSDKYNTLRRIGACFNCLQKGHRLSNCTSKHTCKKCRKPHHTILHPDDSAKESEKSSPSTNKAEQTKTLEQSSTSGSTVATIDVEQQSNFCAQPKNLGKQILLSTAVVLVRGKGGQQYPCRVLLDSGSHTSFVTEQFATLLALEKHPTNVHISCLNDTQTKVRLKIHTQVTSRVNDYTVCMELLVVPKITGVLPSSKVDISTLSLPSGIELADPRFHVPDKINMLLGADVFFDMLMIGRLQLPISGALLQETQFGWVFSGPVPNEDSRVVHSFSATAYEESVDTLVRKFWEIESFGDIEGFNSTIEEECVQHFERTHQRMANGRYMVRLPFNDKKILLGDSRRMAEKRFYGLEKRLNGVPELKQQYSDFLREYEALGHMIENPKPDDSQGFYLPHHYVLKPTSSTTKLRVVFDGSAASDTGISINETQLIGPIVQNDLVSILLNFRIHRFVFTADISKMYRQIAVHKDDRRYQRILWRETQNEPLKTYDLQTVTYGIASSPFLATMSLRQLTEDEGVQYPLASKAIQKSCYMDDALFGADTLPEIIELKNQTVALLAKGGFCVHKFASNSQELLMDIPEVQRERGIEIKDSSINTIMKTLGVAWIPVEDEFTVVLSTHPVDKYAIHTKRTILSQIAKIFDPLGFVGPAVTAAKLIMRELWSLNLEWDQTVPADMAQLWIEYYQQLQTLNNIKIPRWILSEETSDIELHGFADASELAYGACIYTRLKRTDGTAEMKLVCSKSRVLPRKTKEQKQITTPRAELLAAVLLSRLTVKILAAFDIQFGCVTMWSDSQIVLYWIRKSPSELKTYVSNRVREIQNTTGFQWKYIPTKENPADCLSRGIAPKNMESHALWWTGPTMLRIADPIIVVPPALVDEDIPEVKKTVLVTAVTEARLPLFDRISRFSIILRAMAYVVRFCDFLRSGRKKLTKGLPTTDEISRSHALIMRLVQTEAFATELKLLRTKNPSLKLPFRSLHPFIDPNDAILRVGGRLRNAQVPYEYKHQALLPERHPLTITLIRYLHQTNLHSSQRSLLAIVRQRYWPLRAKNIIRKVIYQCIPCYRLKPTTSTQLMGDLPDYRVQPSFPFTRTGLDFAGPFNIRGNHKLRNAQITKGYICVFVCMATRALHLEAVSDLTSEAFLGALQRFVSRRGLIENLYSDNATNFEGANNELRRLAELFRDEQHCRDLDTFCTQRGIKWSFIPPRSPHFGGIWEAGVKSVKRHLMRILAEHNLSFEQFSTVLTQIEAILNSRPLTPTSDDPNDVRAITPAHFLIGREFQAIPEPSYQQIHPGRLSKWQFVQDLKQKFWNLWMTHYLHELQQRQKDFKITTFKIGALVLVVDDNVPPLQWMLARIIELIPGRDGHTRVVGLRLPNGKTTTRAIKKICLLPLDGEGEEPAIPS